MKKHTKKLATSLHAEVWGTLDMRLNESSYNNGYKTDAVKEYERMVKEKYRGDD